MTGEKKTENISRRGERTGRTSRTGKVKKARKAGRTEIRVQRQGREKSKVKFWKYIFNRNGC